MAVNLKSQLNGGATDWVIRVLIGTVVAWSLAELSNMNSRLSELDVKIAEINGTRFTNTDGREMARAISEVAARLELKADKDSVPPDEVIRWLERIEHELHELEALHRE